MGLPKYNYTADLFMVLFVQQILKILKNKMYFLLSVQFLYILENRMFAQNIFYVNMVIIIVRTKI